jgi:hypothetical protein
MFLYRDLPFPPDAKDHLHASLLLKVTSHIDISVLTQDIACTALFLSQCKYHLLLSYRLRSPRRNVSAIVVTKELGMKTAVFAYASKCCRRS